MIHRQGRAYRGVQQLNIARSRTPLTDISPSSEVAAKGHPIWPHHPRTLEAAGPNMGHEAESGRVV